MTTKSSLDRTASFDWPQITTDLNACGWSRLAELLAPDQCDALKSLYASDPTIFRSKVIMQRHGFGRGEYQYFTYPLPELIGHLRRSLYEKLVPIANDWQARLGKPVRFPAHHKDFTALCHAEGQPRPTPLLLKYGPGDYNCLHQDLYGPLVFPLQVAILLSEPGEDFDGGSLVLTEQRPRMQSRPHVVPLTKGDAVIFAVNERPVAGTRDDYRVKLRHGVSEIWRGERYTLGIIFHDAA